MRFVFNVDGESPQGGRYYVTIHRDDCHHARRNDVCREQRYWVRRPGLKDLEAVRVHVGHEIERMQKHYSKKLTPKPCRNCKPGPVR
jgi:hypothetical protein